jgi:hypothetical protein
VYLGFVNKIELDATEEVISPTVMGMESRIEDLDVI